MSKQYYQKKHNGTLSCIAAGNPPANYAVRTSAPASGSLMHLG